jgi:hypothetical protein
MDNGSNHFKVAEFFNAHVGYGNVPDENGLNKPFDNGLLIHTLQTTDRIDKWTGEKCMGGIPYKVSNRGDTRFIRMFIAG